MNAPGRRDRVASSARYYLKNRVRIIERVRAYALAHPPTDESRAASKERTRRYRLKIKKSESLVVARILDVLRRYKLAHKKEVSDWMREHRASEKFKEQRNRGRRERYKNQPEFAVLSRLRNRMRVVVRVCGGKKADKAAELLGAPLSVVREHLERQFRPGMTWENNSVSGWHIDHIRPCAAYDLTDPEQQKKCFHYSNLQPLWATENMVKHSTFRETILA